MKEYSYIYQQSLNIISTRIAQASFVCELYTLNTVERIDIIVYDTVRIGF